MSNPESIGQIFSHEPTKTWNLNIRIGHVTEEQYTELRKCLQQITGFTFNIEKTDSEYDVIESK